MQGKTFFFVSILQFSVLPQRKKIRLKIFFAAPQLPKLHCPFLDLNFFATLSTDEQAFAYLQLSVNRKVHFLQQSTLNTAHKVRKREK